MCGLEVCLALEASATDPVLQVSTEADLEVGTEDHDLRALDQQDFRDRLSNGIDPQASCQLVGTKPEKPESSPLRGV